MTLDGLPILTSAETVAAERAMFDAGIDPYALMTRAGDACAEAIWRIGHQRPTLVLCGPGNNGGDGFVIARALRERGVAVRVAATGDSRTDSARRARAAWAGPVEDIMTTGPDVQLVDALFGVGLTRGLDAALAEKLSNLVDGAQRSYAIDLPSGVDTDAAALLSLVPRFDVTLAIGVLKPAHVLLPAADAARTVLPIAIGLDGVSSASVLAAPHLAIPAADAHKYRRGLVAVVAGRMSGAAVLAAEAAARGGAGYVRIVGAQAILPLPHAIVRASGKDETALADDRIAAVLVGPGLGRDAEDRLRAALAPGHPSVVDADGLALLARTGFGILPDRAILTPHDGEFVALFGALGGNKIDRVREAARRSNSVVVLKGADTVVAAPDGRVRVAVGASTWLSTAGTGDVLAGLCAARLAAVHDPFDAACQAVWLHGDAARRAGAAFVADDLIRHIPAAIAARSR